MVKMESYDVDALAEVEGGADTLVNFAKDVLRALFMVEPGVYDPGREWGADVLAELGQVVDSYELRPPELSPLVVGSAVWVLLESDEDTGYEQGTVLGVY